MRRRFRINNRDNRNIFVFGLKEFLVLFSILFLAGGIFFAIQSTLVFSKIASLERQERLLVRNKFSLQEKFFRANSLNSIVSVANELGFIEDVKVVYLSDDKPIANLP